MYQFERYFEITCIMYTTIFGISLILCTLITIWHEKTNILVLYLSPDLLIRLTKFAVLRWILKESLIKHFQKNVKLFSESIVCLVSISLTFLKDICNQLVEAVLSINNIAQIKKIFALLNFRTYLDQHFDTMPLTRVQNSLQAAVTTSLNFVTFFDILWDIFKILSILHLFVIKRRAIQAFYANRNGERGRLVENESKKSIIIALLFNPLLLQAILQIIVYFGTYIMYIIMHTLKQGYTENKIEYSAKYAVKLDGKTMSEFGFLLSPLEDARFIVGIPEYEACFPNLQMPSNVNIVGVIVAPLLLGFASVYLETLIANNQIRIITKMQKHRKFFTGIWRSL